MKDLLLVFLGGGIGSIVRFLLGKWINTLHPHHFPWGTLVVNVVACFVLGLIVGLADQKQLIPSSHKIFWTIGFCGGFSTFSTFSQETLALLQGGLTISAVSYVALSLVLCIVAVLAGTMISVIN